MKNKTLINRNTLLQNIVSLYLLQGINYLLPLITFPYLVRTLGVEKFGLISFAQVFINYFIIITDYGFNLSATKQISINRYNLEKLSEIFSSTLAIKLMLTLLSFLIMMFIVFSFAKFKHDWLVYFLTFGNIIGNVLLPSWFFQGLENMKFVSLLNISIKILHIIGLLMFVHSESDYIVSITIQTLANLLVGVIGLYAVKRIVNIRLLLPSPSQIKNSLRDGWHIFISTAAINVYTSSNIFILGLIGNNTIVGHFVFADKIIAVVKNIFSPISQSIYPRVNNLARESIPLTINFLKKNLLILGSISFLFSSLVLIYSEKIVLLFSKSNFFESIAVLQWMSFLPFLVTVSNIFGIQTMLTFGLQKQFSRIIVLSGIINLILIFPLGYFLKAKGVAICTLIVEIIVTITMGIVLNKNNINLFKLGNK